MKIRELSEDVYGSLIARGHSNEEIKGMTVSQAFSEYCNWNGLHGWGARLMNVLQELEDAQ